MRNVLSLTYEVLPNQSQTVRGCFADLQRRCKDWIRSKYERQGMYSADWTLSGPIEFDPNGDRRELRPKHHLTVKASAIYSHELISYVWEHPHDTDPLLSWNTLVTIAHDGSSIEFSIIIRIEALELTVQPLLFNIGCPRVLREILHEYQTTLGGWPIPLSYTSVDLPGVEGFVDSVLLNPARHLPVILVSPDVWTGRSLLTGQDLQDALVGVAQVAKLEDKWTAFQLTSKVGKEFSCFNGAMRIYWPGFSVSDAPRTHRLYLPGAVLENERLGRPFSSHLFRVISKVTADRYVDGPLVKAVYRLTAERQQAELNAIRDSVRSGNEAKEDLEIKLLDKIDQVEKLESEVKSLRADLDAVQNSFRQYQEYQDESDVTATAEEAREFQINTVCDAVLLASDRFQDTIEFHPDAEQLAEESPYRNPEEVFGLFIALDELVLKWRSEDGIGTTWKQDLKERSFKYKPDVSDTARGRKFMKQFKVSHAGRVIEAVEHVTIGVGQDPQGCISIYWWRDDGQKKLVVTRCGKHPENTKT